MIRGPIRSPLSGALRAPLDAGAYENPWPGNSAPVGRPTISGTPTENQTLTASTAGITDADGMGTFALQWYADGLAISGATGTTLVLGDPQVGKVITVRATYTDGMGKPEGVTSLPTATVTGVNDTPTGSVSITGTPTQGQILIANTASIADADGLGAFSYQWKRDGSNISGGTSSVYTLVQADVGATITITVSWTDLQGFSESLTSAGLGPVANINDAPTGVPTVTGTATQGQTLTAVTSSIADPDGLGAFSYQWLRNGSNISGATSSTYVLVQADVGTSISVRVSYTDALGTAESVTSAGVGPIAESPNSAPTGSVVVVGVAQLDQTLTADASSVADADGLGPFGYQWLRNGVTISGATEPTYVIVSADLGAVLSVRVSYVDGEGTAESVTSAPTATVTTFTPSSLYGGSDQGLVLDAADISTLWQDTAGTTAVTSAGQTVGRWSDISGKGNHVTQATAGSRPTYRTGNPRVEFNGSSNRLFTASTVNMSGSDKCTVIVSLKTTGTANHGIVSIGGNGAGDFNLGWYSGAGSYRAINYNGGTEAGVTLASADRPAVPHTRVMTAEVDRSKSAIALSSRLRIDGDPVADEALGTGALSGNLGNRSISIGDWLSAFYLQGDIYRVIIINRLLTEAERFAAEHWCGDAAGRTVIAPNAPPGEADVNHLMVYGQSLSLGAQSRPAISTSANNHYTLGGGGAPRFWEGVGYAAANMVAHVERDSTIESYGETPLYGCYQIIDQIQNPYSKQFLATAPGMGAVSIAELSSGTGYYTRLIAGVTLGRDKSRALGKQYKVRAILWMQGESDGGNTSYAANLNTLLGTLNTDIKAVTRQPDDIWLISYQVDRAQIGLAHLAASDTYARIRVAMPMYMLAHTDGVHLTAAASKIAGAYFGLAYKRLILDGETDWQPLRIQSATRSGATLDVVYNPIGLLALDTTTVAAQSNSGYRLFAADGTTALTISSVALLNATTVRVTAAASIPAGAILRYGFSDPTDHSIAVAKGNLRDSQGASIVFDSAGVNWPMHNWAVLEQRALT